MQFVKLQLSIWQAYNCQLRNVLWIYCVVSAPSSSAMSFDREMCPAEITFTTMTTTNSMKNNCKPEGFPPEEPEALALTFTPTYPSSLINFPASFL